MPSITVENYLKQIYLEQQHREEQLVPMGQLAAAVSVTPGTATSMVKTLADAKLVDYAPRGGVRLTPEGTRLALQVLRRHRLIELFLVEVLHLDWSEVHDEAEELEHAISDKVLERIDILLGHPDTDPHGDPIPAAHDPESPAPGTPGSPEAPDQPELVSLTDCPPASRVTIARILDQSPGFLQFLDRHGLTPGSEVALQAHSPSADAITLQPADHPPVTLGTTAAAKILGRVWE